MSRADHLDEGQDRGPLNNFQSLSLQPCLTQSKSRNGNMKVARIILAIAQNQQIPVRQNATLKKEAANYAPEATVVSLGSPCAMSQK